MREIQFMHASFCWLLSTSELENRQLMHMNAYLFVVLLWLADECLCRLFEARWNCENDNMFWNPFNHITLIHLFNGP